MGCIGAGGWAPVVRLLGGTVRPLDACDSYGVVDPNDDADVMAASVASGFKAIKIKGGDGDLSRDVTTVRRVRGCGNGVNKVSHIIPNRHTFEALGALAANNLRAQPQVNVRRYLNLLHQIVRHPLLQRICPHH